MYVMLVRVPSSQNHGQKQKKHPCEHEELYINISSDVQIEFQS